MSGALRHAVSFQKNYRSTTLLDAARSFFMAQVKELSAEYLDRAGMFASALCFVHCVATPVVLSLSAVSSHFIPSEEHTHRVLAVFVTIIGAAAIGFGYRRHKRRRVLVAALLGLALICGGAYFGDLLPSHRCEVAVTLAGSICMIFAHRMNHTFCKNCKKCTHL
jgi:peptidoglycan/LPS O-acetylase OafA/YrhL